MFWHLRMILAYKKTLGKFTKVLGFEKTPPLGKIPKKSRIFFGKRPLANILIKCWNYWIFRCLGDFHQTSDSIGCLGGVWRVSWECLNMKLRHEWHFRTDWLANIIFKCQKYWIVRCPRGVFRSSGVYGGCMEGVLGVSWAFWVSGIWNGGKNIC